MKEGGSEHETHHKSAHHLGSEHHHHAGEANSNGKSERNLFMVAFGLALVILAINIYNGNYLFAFAALGATAVLIPVYLKRYLAATVVATALILILTIAYRVALLHYFGFYEPDGFYHLAVVRAAVLHDFIVPQFLSISGWPQHTLVSEPVGLYWTTLVPYFFLQFAGISYYDVMRLVPVLFALLDVIATYYLIREFSNDRLFGLLGMLFVALSMGDAARTSATVYRGDGFVTIFVILGLIFMIRTLKAVGNKRMIGYALLTGFALSIGNVVWNGASFGIAIYILAVALILLYAFLVEKLETIKKTRYLMLALVFWYLLASLYKALNLIGAQNEAFTGIYFLVLLALLFAGNEIALFLSKNKERFGMYTATLQKRLGTSLVFAIGSIMLIYLLAPQIVESIFVTSGFQTNIAFAASIQELQAPTPPFLMASFGTTLFMAPMSILLYISSYYPATIDLFWVVVMAVTAMYLFMDFEGEEKGKFLSGKAIVRFRVNEPLLVFISYYAVTAYLQMHAVRFNSLLSIPLAIFAAYTIYWVLLAQKSQGKLGIFALSIFSAMVMFGIVFNIVGIDYIYIAGIILVSAAIYYQLGKLGNSSLNLGVGIAMLALLIGYIMMADVGYSTTLIQADNINPSFISAMQWMKNNTAANATVLTLWPDGSLVEGVANRTSVTDSVGSQNRSKAGPFAIWLFNTTRNPQFLTSNINGRPDYILARYTWLQETSGIYTETEFNYSNYNQSLVKMLLGVNFHGSSANQLNSTQKGQLNTMISQLYAYSVFDSFQENVNATNQSYTFYSTQQGLTARVTINNLNGSQKINSYLQVGQYSSPFRNLLFYNSKNASYQTLIQNYNSTNNQTLVMQYSPVPKPGAYVNITAVYMMNIGIANSNMFKLIFACGQQSCEWSNNVARLQLVYINDDSKIFRVIYNNTAS